MKASQLEYSSFEAKAHLADLLRQVEAGEQIAITKRGKRVALLVPYARVGKDEQLQILSRFREMRAQIKMKGHLNIKDLVNEGRKG